MEKKSSIRLSPRSKSSSHHSSPRALSSVDIELNPLGRPVRTPIQAWVELPKAASSSSKKPAKLSFVKPTIPVLTQPTQSKKGKFSFLNKNQIHSTVPTVPIVHNPNLGLPSKFMAIYYVDLIYDTIRLLVIEIKRIIVNTGKVTYIYPPIFNVEAVSKLEKLIHDIDKNRYIYTTSLTKLTKTKDIKVLYLFVKYLIKKPRDKDSFLAHMTGIKIAQGFSYQDIRDYYNDRNRFDGIYFQRVIDYQNSGLSSKIIKSLSIINHHDVENKLQSLNNTMAVFIDIINNILNDNVETRVTRFSGGYVFFANYRYNKDEKEYTPLINNYIDAYKTNFQNIYDYFQNIFKYFKKINKRMGNMYVKEYGGVEVAYVESNKSPTQHTQHTQRAQRDLRTRRTTNDAVDGVKKQLDYIRNDDAKKGFEKSLKKMKDKIAITNDEIDNLYKKV